MKNMSVSGKIGYVILSLGIILLGVGVSGVSAETITSPSYKIDGNFGGSFGGQTSSTSYKMTAIGGEAIVGAGSSGSYIIDQQQSSASTQMMQLGVQPSGLVGYYPMDENTGTTTADASQYQNNGSFNSNASWHSSGKIGSAVHMNGTADGSGSGAIYVPDNTNLPSGSAMTIESWVKQDPANGTLTIAVHGFDDGTINSSSWAFHIDNDRIGATIAYDGSDSGQNYVSTAGGTWTTANVWRHVAMVYDGTQGPANRVKIYLDGVALPTTVTGIIATSLRNVDVPLAIGAWPGLGMASNAALDHVKLFNRALSPAEISAEYTAQNAGVATGLALGTTTNESKMSLVDAIVRTNVTGYNLAIQQDHDLQNGANTIPAISGGSIASPLTWSDGVTKGLGFTLMNAPNIDGKWGSGASYAALPSIATTFYTNTGHTEGAVDVINARLRLDTDTPQVPGSYTNNITYTGTMIP